MERELENNSANKNPNNNNNNKSNNKTESTPANKLNKKENDMQRDNFDKKSQNENPKKVENSALEKKYSFNSESDESDLINRLLEKKQVKNSIIKNYNSNNGNKFNRNSSNKYNNNDYNKNNSGSNNFGIKFTRGSKNNIEDSNDDEISENDDEEILSEDINSISEENIFDKKKNTNINTNTHEYNLSLNESLNKSPDVQDINKFSKSKRLEYSFGEDNKVDIKINQNKRRLVLNESLVSSDESEPETAKSTTKKGLDMSKFRELLEEQEKQQASESNADFIGFKAPYSSSTKNQSISGPSSNKNDNLSNSQNNISTNNGKKKDLKKDITTVDFIAFSKPTIQNSFSESPAPEQNETSIQENLAFFLNKPIFPQYPWITAKTAEYKGMLKLHFEICDFYNYIKPLPSEHEIRKKSFGVLKELIVGKFPGWRVKVFGSYPNEIFLSDSDVDIVVISSDKKDNAKKTMDKLYDYLYLNSNLFDYIKRIDAKVPIIKLQLKETKINLDISVDRKNGYDAKRIIKKSLNDFHALKPLIYLLKYFMRQKKLNETFSGGISSFLLFNLVLAFLQYKSKTENSPSLNLGQLLVDFFQFYGFEFNYDEVGISVRYGGFFYKRKDKDTGRPAFLSIENFQDVTQNIGSGAYKFRKILDCFKQARDGLYYPSTYPIHSYLGQFITTDSFLRNRYRFMHDE